MAGLKDKLAQHAKQPSSPVGLNLSTKRDILTEIPLGQIEPDPDQPRKDLGDLSELSASIKEVGVVQPIIVSVIDGVEKYRILAGERRFSAARVAGLSRIPAIVRGVEEHERLGLQIIENLHRKDLTPFEEAKAYEVLSTQFGLRQEEIARKLGCSQESVSEALRLLTLPQGIQESFEEANRESGGRISRSLLLELARQPEGEQGVLWEQARRGELTVGKVRAARKSTRKSSSPMPSISGASFRYPIHLDGVTVTLEFSRAAATFEDIVEALELALQSERTRLNE